MLIQDNYKI